MQKTNIVNPNNQRGSKDILRDQICRNVNDTILLNWVMLLRDFSLLLNSKFK